MQSTKIIELLKPLVEIGEIKINEPMSKHTTFRVGGNADILIIPKNKEEIINVIKVCSKNDIPLMIIGNGSNLLVGDKGIRGVVMKIYNNYSDIKVDGQIITAQSGALLSKIANIALKSELSGFEFASGIPGTLGGAVIMNAGAYGGEMKDVVLETTYIDETGKVKTIKNIEHEFGYRHSYFQGKKHVILQSKLKLNNGKFDEIKANMDELNSRRRAKQPLSYPSAGSVFKRPEGYYAGKLIEDCGLKGYSIGGAQVSELHAGFIINKGNATCKDVVDLINYIQNEVKKKFGVEMQTEVKVIGEE